MNNDISSNLRLVREWAKKPLVHHLLDIQEHGEDKQSSWDWRNDWRLLTLNAKDDRLLKYATPKSHEWIEYTALSYPWSSSLYEEAATYNWHIQTDENRRRANVRDAVLDRVAKFMRHFEVEYLWIDLECINQSDEDEKRRVMGKMHQIYARSVHPLALLYVPIRTEAELSILTRLLNDDLVKSAHKKGSNENAKESQQDSDVYLLASKISPKKAYDILDLIHRVLSDEWWSRAWCFQEEYVSMKKMTLLLPTFVNVTGQEDSEVMSFMDGEIAIGSRDFRRAATRFVFAYVATAAQDASSWVVDKGMCRNILEKAGWYTFMSVHGHTLNLESRGKALTTQILADIRGKKYTIPSDLIHISTNCNFYPVTLNTRRLNQENQSLALAMLTLFFLNGEIFRNGRDDGPSLQEAADLNAFEYLKAIAFDAFPATGGPGQLARLRRYRFISPLLSSHGVRTHGLVWQIDQVLKVFPTMRSPISSSTSSISSELSDTNQDEETVEVMTMIRDNLPVACTLLRRAITGFIEHEFDRYWQDERTSKADARSMAAADLAAAVRAGRHVGLGHIINFDKTRAKATTKLGLFSVDENVSTDEPVFVFTAWQARPKKRSRHHQQQFVQDRYISLQVSIDEPTNVIASPSLRTKARIQNLCFCAGISPTIVTFPWPSTLVI